MSCSGSDVLGGKISKYFAVKLSAPSLNCFLHLSEDLNGGGFSKSIIFMTKVHKFLFLTLTEKPYNAH